MNVGPIIESLLDGVPVAEPQALMSFLISGDATEAQIAGVLTALKGNGVSSAELAGFARGLQAAAIPVEHEFDSVVDSCGTGGGIPSFNISTAASFVAAAAGARVAKHGNRAVTSSCGSMDVLEALGVRLDVNPVRQSEILRDSGLIFMFAPNHHPAMRHVGKVRRELATRTVFNQLGPLANPAAASAQLIGVYDAKLLEPMALAAVELGIKRVLCVHGDDGMDEISPVAPTSAVFGDETGIHHLTLPPLYGDADCRPGETIAENAVLLREAISDPNSARCLAILPSAGAVLWLAGLADSVSNGALLARGVIAQGLGAEKLDQMIGATNR